MKQIDALESSRVFADVPRNTLREIAGAGFLRQCGSPIVCNPGYSEEFPQSVGLFGP
jgi:hypothetical protein